MLKDFATANGRYIKCAYRDLNSLNSHTDMFALNVQLFFIPLLII